ncbi:MAG TPA: 30S ribosomal protein S1 [Blastocatellia bacterium]|jgi:small subunit ribosomal protein S1|nr:30S ribosomal protein S1 [Blastocatellia bacterium]HAF22363.1 30S ribosomal protein S1 [Blastocatellia bacterium]HCX32044.1 30S ribosomal protein S1 [Blastocatellia bacterium]
MASEESKLNNDEVNNNPSSGEQEPAPSISTQSAPKDASPSAASRADDDEESRPPGDVDFGQLLDQFEQEQASLQEGEVVRGTVVGISERGVVIDFGYKSEGIVNPAEFTENGVLAVKPGDEVDVLVKNMETADGLPVLSRADAVRMKAWDDLEKSHREGTSVKGRVIERIKGGLRVDIDGIAAFLPGSQVDVRPVRNLDSLRNQEIEAKVIKLNRKRSNVVLSRKAVIEEENAGKKGQTLQHIEEDIVVEGQIKNLTDYGAFVDLGGVDGLLHVTDMSWGRLQNPSELFRVGDSIQVKVLKFDRERERVSLGYKQLLPDPWSSVEERFPVGTRVPGRIASVADYGAFVELENGVEGLVHVSEMSWSKRVKHPSKLVNPGDSVEVEVLSVDPKARRISLGMKQIQDNPWQTLHERYQVGTRVHGRVRNLTDFGAFIEIEDGVDGLVHVSDISWSRRIKHPSEVLKKGQEIDAIITSIDAENRRLSLSIKDLEPNAWDRFVTEHKPGDVVRGKIARFANFGAFIELDDNLEGLCHISELSEARVEKPEDVVQLGQEMDFKILRIDAESKKIGLSARAVGKEDEPVVDTKVYSSQAGSGMASLGELADFGLGKTVSEPVPEPEPTSAPELVREPEPQPEPVAEPAPEPQSEESSTAPELEAKAEAGAEEDQK